MSLKIFIKSIKNGELEVLIYITMVTKEIPLEAFRCAAQNGHINICKWLLSLPKKYKINPAENKNKAFIYAAGGGHLHVLKWLMTLPEEFGIDPAAEDNEAFRYAAIGKQLDVCKWLISLPKKYEIEPDARNNWAFRKAAKEGHLDVCKWLITLPAVILEIIATVKYHEKFKEVRHYHEEEHMMTREEMEYDYYDEYGIGDYF